MGLLRTLRDGFAKTVDALRDDVAAAMRNDPAARDTLEVVLTYPGVHALWGHRLAHTLWSSEQRLSARVVAAANRFVTGVEIHPGATIGRGVFIDHGMGVVIGETATVGDNCLLYKGVVLGGVSLERGPRHPQLGKGVVVGSNACVLGNIEVGEGARIGSGSVVVRNVPSGATVVGVPGRVVPRDETRRARFERVLDHASLPDPVSDMLRSLAAQNEALRQRVAVLEAATGVRPDANPCTEGPHDGEDPFAHAPEMPSTHGG